MQSGQIVAGKYRLNQVLGSGGMAEVWSATNTFTDRQLAIKFMNKEVGKTSEAATRFLKEAKVSARINHPNVIEIHDVGQTDDGQLFLVMELLTGFPLEVALKRQTPPMTSYEFALVMLEVAQALEAAHRVGIVHRDLKPTNIFLHKIRDGVAIPKLLDFGVSKFLEDDQNHALTIAGTVLGSPLYMSPEQARGDMNLDGRTDVFAFGAILFEALCGFRAYEAKNFNALIVRIATTKPKRIDECAPHVPEALRAVVRACLETDLRYRAQSFEDVVRLLRVALPELGESEVRLPTPLTSAFPTDPDATNALPVIRASDRPPPVVPFAPVTAPLGTPRRSAAPPAPAAGPAPYVPGAVALTPGSVPPGAHPAPSPSGPTGPSWHTPNPSYASVHGAPAPDAARGPTMLIAAAAALVAVLGATTGLVWRSRAGGADGHTGIVVAAAPAKVAGELVVSAQPGACLLVVDGKERGATPVSGLVLAAGPHNLECRTNRGAVKTATATVQDGTVTRYKFLLDD
jgi:serine/threonine-protein kinase